jgi:hypothetical protein
MSRGHGFLMRRVLDELTDEWQPVVYLAADIEGDRDGRVDRSVEESTRRACKRLADQGLAELAYMSMSTGRVSAQRPGQGLQRMQLVVRATPDHGQ